MNKRAFLKSGAALGTAAAFAPYASTALAQALQGYQIIDPPLNTRVADKVEVIEYFWVGCPHCFAFEPIIENWKENDKPDYIEFVKEAPPLNPSWEPHSRAFYAAEQMGISDQVIGQLFSAIHVDKRRLRSPEQLVEFVEELGIDGKEFAEQMDTFTTTTRLSQSNKLAGAAGISGVPSVVINGKYLTGASLAGSLNNVISVINELSAKEHELMQAG